MFDEVLAVELIDQQDFNLFHSEVGSDGTKTRRCMHLKDLMGDASRWVRAIEDCKARGITVDSLYRKGLREHFEMQGVLMKKHRTSKGWDKRFFVLSVRHRISLSLSRSLFAVSMFH